MPKLTCTPEDDEPPMAPVKDLRDEFAMAVLTGLAAYPHRIGEDNKPEHFAIWSYAIADAMLAARTK